MSTAVQNHPVEAGHRRRARTWGAVAAAAYVGTIVAANAAVNHYGAVPVGLGLTAPAGVFFAGLAFTLRDATQETLGKLTTLGAIAAGATLSYATGGGRVAIAGALAFLVSELADFAVYTPLRRRGWLLAVAASNVVGLLIDSVLFLWLAFGSLAMAPGQAVGKSWVTALTIAVVWVGRGVRRGFRYGA